MRHCLACSAAAVLEDHEVIDLETAQTAHLEWLGRVMTALQHGHPPSDLLCETANKTCVFARWLAGFARSEGVDGAQVAALAQCHDEMHGMAADLLICPTSDSAYFTSLDMFCRKAVMFNRLLAEVVQPTLPESAAKTAERTAHPNVGYS